jgi:hypothetical protein
MLATIVLLEKPHVIYFDGFKEGYQIILLINDQEPKYFDGFKGAHDICIFTSWI